MKFTVRRQIASLACTITFITTMTNGKKLILPSCRSGRKKIDEPPTSAFLRVKAPIMPSNDPSFCL